MTQYVNLVEGTQFVLLPGNVANLCPKSHHEVSWPCCPSVYNLLDTSIEKQSSSEKNKINETGNCFVLFFKKDLSKEIVLSSFSLPNGPIQTGAAKMMS